jgi:hypothetical protein
MYFRYLDVLAVEYYFGPFVMARRSGLEALQTCYRAFLIAMTIERDHPRALSSLVKCFI